MTTAEKDVDVVASEEEPTRTPFPQGGNRFLFVDVAAQRAKQLRRGALPRLPAAEASGQPETPHKLERIAMEEVNQGIIPFELPEAKANTAEETG